MKSQFVKAHIITDNRLANNPGTSAISFLKCQLLNNAAQYKFVHRCSNM